MRRPGRKAAQVANTPRGTVPSRPPGIRAVRRLGWMAALVGAVVLAVAVWPSGDGERPRGDRDAVLDGARRHITALDRAAVTSLDARAGRATVIAVVERKRVETTMTRTGDGWRPGALTPVPATAGPTRDGTSAEPAAAAATGALTSVFTYTPQNVAATERAAARWLTGTAADQYRRLFGQVERLAPAQRVALTTRVVRTGIVSLTRDAARLLVFLDQTSTRAGRPAGTPAAAQLTVTVRRTGAHWTITELGAA